jgi:predicted RNA-binding protein with PUA-like domain
MSFWLMKSEPDVFGVDDLAAAPKRTTGWDGVRNYQARNFMRDQMKRGDRVFFYHSNCAEPGIAGIAKVVREGYPDHTAFDARDPHYDPGSDPDNPRWYMVDIQLERKLGRLISLADLKRHADAELRGFALLKRGNRLSVLPVSAQQWSFILSLERA